uniref:PRA1 family protein n=1 Tax=Rhizophora mucronata TaxID=61149 RepID=A0A2P2QEC8_RHIMU
MTYVGSLYLLLLRALPNSNLLHKVIDKGLILALLAFVTVAGLILTHAAMHLLLTLAAATPIVLLHAVLWVREDLHDVDYEENNSTGELAPLVQDSGEMV